MASGLDILNLNVWSTEVELLDSHLEIVCSLRVIYGRDRYVAVCI